MANARRHCAQLHLSTPVDLDQRQQGGTDAFSYSLRYSGSGRRRKISGCGNTLAVLREILNEDVEMPTRRQKRPDCLD